MSSVPLDATLSNVSAHVSMQLDKASFKVSSSARCGDMQVADERQWQDVLSWDKSKVSAMCVCEECMLMEKGRKRGFLARRASSGLKYLRPPC